MAPIDAALKWAVNEVQHMYESYSSHLSLQALCHLQIRL